MPFDNHHQGSTLDNIRIHSNECSIHPGNGKKVISIPESIEISNKAGVGVCKLPTPAAEDGVLKNRGLKLLYAFYIHL